MNKATELRGPERLGCYRFIWEGFRLISLEHKPVKQKQAETVAKTMVKEKKPQAPKPQKLEGKSRLSKKEAAEYLGVSTSTMLRLLKNRKISHMKYYKNYHIPVKALELYVSSEGSATWTDQAEKYDKQESWLFQSNKIISLPAIKPKDAIKEIKYPLCETNCWHFKLAEEILELDNEYEVCCYKCAARIEDV